MKEKKKLNPVVQWTKFIVVLVLWLEVYRGPGALAGVSVLGEVMVGTACGAFHL